MLTLDRYITRHANRTIFVVVTILVVLISLFALFEELDAAREAYDFSAAATYVMKTMPRRFDEILVYGLFLGYLIALGHLAETNELTVVRVSGMSPTRIAFSLAPSMVLWLVISFAVSEFLAPNSERDAEVGKLKAQYGENALGRLGGLWLRVGQLYMRVNAIGDDGRIQGVVQYWLDPSDTLIETINAEYGDYDDELGRWTLYTGARTVLSPASAETFHFDTWTWPNALTPDLLASQAYVEPNKMSLAALARQIEFARTQSVEVAEYELAFWSRVLKPLTYLGLTLFALAVVMGPLRQVGMGLRLTFGIFAGLGFKYLQDLFAPAALVFNIPALIAILIPIGVYWAIAILLIRRNA